MRIAFFEDRLATAFGPLVELRPTFELVCGQRSVRERIVDSLQPAEWGAFLRPRLAELYAEEHPTARVNDRDWLEREPTLLVNGRWLPAPETLENVDPGTVGLIDDTLAYLILQPREARAVGDLGWHEALGLLAQSRRFTPVEGTLLRHPWDLVDSNPAWIQADASASDVPVAHEGLAVVGPRERLRIAADVDVDPYVVFDVRRGPITIDSGAVLQAFTRIEGPAYVGRGSRLFRANVRGGTTIGPDCRVGGEVEASILHGCVNKYHDGFLGHAYVGPWVNLGALTTNSDLKSDYSPVRVPIAGQPVDSGRTKVGCFVGDHAKTGLGTLFNTGSSIGVMCIALPNGRLMPKHLPSFTRFWNGELVTEPDLDGALDTARLVMQRRDRALTPAGERAIRAAFEATSGERDAAIGRFRDRERQRSGQPVARAG